VGELFGLSRLRVLSLDGFGLTLFTGGDVGCEAADGRETTKVEGAEGVVGRCGSV
jgi:hypothetical protein